MNLVVLGLRLIKCLLCIFLLSSIDVPKYFHFVLELAVDVFEMFPKAFPQIDHFLANPYHPRKKNKINWRLVVTLKIDEYEEHSETYCNSKFILDLVKL